MTDQQTEAIDDEIEPIEKAKIAKFLLTVYCDDPVVVTWPSWLDSHQDRLDTALKQEGKRRRNAHWRANWDNAMQAASHYVEAKKTDPTVTLAGVAMKYDTSHRSLVRALKRLRNGASGQA